MNGEVDKLQINRLALCQAWDGNRTGNRTGVDKTFCKELKKFFF